MAKMKKTVSVSADQEFTVLLGITGNSDLYLKQDNEVVFITEPYVNNFITALIQITGYDLPQQVQEKPGSDAAAAEHPGQANSGTDGTNY